jgi:dolichol-phosphate mannosyltransferase
MQIPDDVTAIIAARNEEASIADVVASCLPYVSSVIVVIDRRTSDRTRERATMAGARVIVDDGRGKGQAMRLGIVAVTTPLTLFLDADGSHEVDDIPQLMAPLLDGTADHVSASRLIGGSSELHGGFDEFFRLAGSSFITACINRRFGVQLSDSQNGFRAIRTDVLREIKLTSDGTTIEQEMIMKSLALGYRVREIPSHEHKRLAGASNINVRRVAWRYVANMVKHLVFIPRRRTRPSVAPSERPVDQPAPAHDGRL